VSTLIQNRDQDGVFDKPVAKCQALRRDLYLRHVSRVPYYGVGSAGIEPWAEVNDPVHLDNIKVLLIIPDGTGMRIFASCHKILRLAMPPHEFELRARTRVPLDPPYDAPPLVLDVRLLLAG